MIRAYALLPALPTVAHALVSGCPNVPAPLYPYSLAPGWFSVKVADGLHTPRDLVLDSHGRLLIVESGLGISQHTVDTNGCVNASQLLISSPELNHGIYLGGDGTTLYASDTTTVFSWAYDPTSGGVSNDNATVVSGMANNGHATRTLIIPPNHPDLLVVSHGSNANLDLESIDPAVARAIVKVFNLTTIPEGGYNYVADGWNAGFGLRNDVGLAFDGNNMLWSVENSADDLVRDVNGTNVDVHTDNPAEELNFLGDVAIPNNNWYGYPACFTVWNPDEFPDRVFQIGEQFVQVPSADLNDTSCAQMSVAPQLSFQAHSAPLGCKFDSKFSNLFITMHGSWDRQPPTGYKVVAVPFVFNEDDSGGVYAPSALPSSNNGAIDVFFPPDEGSCSASSCIRPVGLVFDSMGRLYVTSDTSGEVFLLSQS